MRSDSDTSHTGLIYRTFAVPVMHVCMLLQNIFLEMLKNLSNTVRSFLYRFTAGLRVASCDFNVLLAISF